MLTSSSSLLVSEITRAITGPKNLILRTFGVAPKPRWLVFEVTDACNSRCKHCDIWRTKPTKNILTCKEIEKIFGDNLFGGLEEIILTGGEPTLRHDLEEVMLTIRKILPKTKIWLSTNGLLPQRVLNAVKVAIEHGINIGVGVSLDGVGEKHDLVRGVEGNFERADYLLRELIALREKHGDKIRLAVAFTLSDLTLNSFKETLAYAQGLNVAFVLQIYEEAIYYHNVGKNLVNADLIKAIRLLPCSLHSEMCLKALMGKPTKFPCFAMYTFCLLRCNGDIVPCLRLAEVRAGNVKECPSSVVWHNASAKKGRKLVKSCKGCLNTWGIYWSFLSYYMPIRHIRELIFSLLWFKRP